GQALGSGAVAGGPGGAADDEEAEARHHQALGPRDAGAPGQAHREHRERYRVVRRIAAEVDRVGQQGDRARAQAGAELDHEHCGVDGQCDPQGPAKAGSAPCVHVVVRVTVVGHEGLLNLVWWIRHLVVATRSSEHRNVPERTRGMPMSTDTTASAMRIGQLADATGVDAETIRYYERIGILAPPARSPNGYRSYGPAQL